ncbi:GFA family protein [Rhizobium halophytocola]|uniref:CENP-V/GFA domain-containing protein n=1 Tax=Rhizobium halophytocola TaxID=735519 RepID=A0ABS4DZK4_9HYPH|nr:GFA family protein [Rhizobium halophytocola]MBP1851113.1 hypothetical protein [Rhizobium halophytocola]
MSSEGVVQGSCRCGQVKLKVRGKPVMTMACHCTGCQKMSASAFSLSALYPQEAFEVAGKEPVLGGTQGEIRHFCCPDCKSWMFTRFDGMGPFVNVRATMLDNAHHFKPFMETQTAEKLPWATTPAVHSFERFPAPAAYPKMMEAFAQSDYTG